MDEDISPEKSGRSVIGFIGSLFTKEAFRQYGNAFNPKKYDKERVMIWNLSSFISYAQAGFFAWAYNTFPLVQTVLTTAKSVIVAVFSWTVSVVGGLIALFLAPTP